MAEQDSRSQQLIRLYNEVDAFMRQQYGHDKYAEHVFLIQELSTRNRVIAQHQQEMRAVAQLRNSLVHNPFSHFDGPVAEPHAEILKRYQSIRDALMHPRNALSIAIPASKIFTATPQSNVIKTLRAMRDNIYTHVPIMDEGRLVGIFSENTLLSYVADAGEIIITGDMTVADFADYIPLDAHASEMFEFLPKNALLGRVFEVFNKAIHEHRRIGMVFITEHGKNDEKPLGIITAWDLASPDFELG